MFVGLILLALVNKKSRENPYILALACEDEKAEQEAAALAASSVRRCVTKSKTVSASGVELTLEVRLEAASVDFVNRLAQVPGVRSAVLVSYNGEYMS